MLEAVCGLLLQAGVVQAHECVQVPLVPACMVSSTRAITECTACEAAGSSLDLNAIPIAHLLPRKVRTNPAVASAVKDGHRYNNDPQPRAP